VATGRIPVEEAGGMDAKDSKDSKDSKESKKKAKEKKRPPVTVANLCVRNALLAGAYTRPLFGLSLALLRDTLGGSMEFR